MRNMRQLHPQWPQPYGQPKIHKLGAQIRSALLFPSTTYPPQISSPLKPLANSSIHLKDNNDFKQYLNKSILLDIPTSPTTPPWTSNFSKGRVTNVMKKSLSTTILHFQDKPQLLPPTYLLPSSNPLYPSVYTTPTLNSTANSTQKPLEEQWDPHLAEIRVSDVGNTTLTTNKVPPNTY